MKKKQNENNLEVAETLKWLSHEEVFGDLHKDKAYQKAYDEEIARRRLAAQVRGLRAEKHLTQKAVAERAGMPQSVIARMESGERGISVDTLGKVARALGKEIQLV